MKYRKQCLIPIISLFALNISPVFADNVILPNKISVTAPFTAEKPGSNSVTFSFPNPKAPLQFLCYVPPDLNGQPIPHNITISINSQDIQLDFLNAPMSGKIVTGKTDAMLFKAHPKQRGNALVHIQFTQEGLNKNLNMTCSAHVA